MRSTRTMRTRTIGAGIAAMTAIALLAGCTAGSVSARQPRQQPCRDVPQRHHPDGDGDEHRAFPCRRIVRANAYEESLLHAHRF